MSNTAEYVDGSVILEVKADVSKADKSLAKLKTKIEKMEKDLDSKESDKSAISKQLEDATQKAEKTRAAIKQLKFELSSVRDALDTSKSKPGEVDPFKFQQAFEREKEITKELEAQEKVLAAQEKESDQLLSKYQKVNTEAEKITSEISGLKEEAGKLQQRIDEGTEKMRQFADNAEVADQHVVDLYAELSKLKEAQKTFADLGIGPGHVAYEETYSRITEINRELKEYHKTLTNVKAASDSIEPPDISPGGIDIEQRRAEIMERQQTLFNAVSERLRALNELTGEVAGSIQAKLSTSLSPLYEKMAPSLDRIKEKLSDVFGPLAEKLDMGTAKQSIQDGLDGIQGAVSNFAKRIAPDLKYTAGSVGLVFDGLANSLRGIPQKLSSAFSGLSGIAGTLPKISGSAANAFRSILTNAYNAASAVNHFGASAARYLLSAAKNAFLFAAKLNVFSRLSEKLTKKFGRLGQMIRRVFIFSVITSGLRAIRSQMSGYLKVNAEFTTALRRLQGVFLTAFQPIYEVVVPALTTLINVLARAVAVVTKFFSALFGTTAKQAQANAKDLYEQANATTAAGNAAEKASKQLAGFDEINKLEGSKSAGGGGATSVDTGPLFDFEYEETPFDSWGEAFSAFLDKLLSGIPKLMDAFKNFADWLNGLNQKLYDMFTFPGVLEKVKQLGRDLADALNDLVNWIDWELWGRALGAGLNLALNFLTAFLYEFDWMNLGKRLAEFVNGLVDEIDWYEFGRLLWAGFKIALETLAGFILGLNMPLLAEAASQTVIGFFTEMKNTIDKIPWGEIGTQIATFLTSLDWAGMFESVYNAILSALEGIRGLITGFLSSLGEWTEPLIGIVNTIIDTIERLMETTRTWASSIDLTPVSNAFGNLMSAIDKLVAVISDGLLWAYENVLLPLAGWAIEEAAPVMMNALAEAIEFLSAVLERLKPVAEWVWNNFLQPLAGFAWGVISGALEVITNILQKLTDLLTGNKTFSDFIDSLAPGEAIILGIAAALGILGTAFAVSSVISAAGALISGAITAIGAALAFLTSPIGIVIGVISALAAGFMLLYKHVEPFRNFIDSIIGWAKELVPGIQKGISDAWSAFTSWLDGIWQGIVDGFKSFFGIHSPSTVMAEQGGFLIAGLLQGISEAWNSIVEFFNTAVENLKQFFSDAWEAIKTAASEAWENITETLSQTWESLQEFAITAFTAIKDRIGEAWDNIKTKTSEIWEAVKAFLSDAWENLKTSAQEKFDFIRQKISEIWDSIKQKTEEIWENVKTAIFNAWESIKTTVSEAVSSIFETVTGTFRSLIDSALTWGSDICKNIADGIASGIRWVTNAVKNVADSIKDFLGFSEPKKGPLSNFHTYMPDMLELMSDGIRSNTHLAVSAASDLADAVANSLNRRTYTLGNVNMGRLPDFSNMKIPKLAQGAVIPPNREFMAVLGDQKHGNNIEAPVSEIESAVTRALRASGMSGGGNITVVMEIDGREFGRASYKYGNQEQQRVGVRMTEARS